MVLQFPYNNSYIIMAGLLSQHRGGGRKGGRNKGDNSGKSSTCKQSWEEVLTRRVSFVYSSTCVDDTTAPQDFQRETTKKEPNKCLGSSKSHYGKLSRLAIAKDPAIVGQSILN